jgi:hypothetical protein
MPCSKCSSLLVEDACHTCDDDDALVDVNDDTCSCALICTSCMKDRSGDQRGGDE